jgi:hypothetical protein
MIRTALKLIVVLLILNALFRVGSAYWTHYHFQDEVQQLAQFSERATPEELRDKVLAAAASYQIPLDAEALTVTRSTGRIEVDASYSRDIEVVPTYKRHWPFTIHVVVMTLS